MKIILDRQKCIGCGSCAAVCPQLFELVSDGRSHLKNSNKAGLEIEELEVLSAGCGQDAADVCTVLAIKIQ